MSNKNRVNLLQPVLLPVRQYITLNTTVFGWGIMFLFMTSLYFYQTNRLAQLETVHTNIQQEFNQQNILLAELQTALAGRKVDQKLVSELALLKSLLKNKQALQSKMSDHFHSSVAGLARIMTELAKFHHVDISLQHVQIDNDTIVIKGVAQNAEAVPNWLSGFESSTFLSGQQFAEFSIEVQKDNVTRFSVSTLIGGTKNNVNNVSGGAE